MSGVNYPGNWDEVRSEVLEKHLHRCVNCHEVGGQDTLEVHHIVPVGQAGSHQISNLVPLCHQCHRAAHREAMAPRVRWYTNGELSSDEFSQHKRLWQQMRERLGVPRFDPDEECVYVPVADTDRIVGVMPT